MKKQGLSGFHLIDDLLNRKQFGFFESDPTQSSTHGKGGVHNTTLHRALRLEQLGFLIFL